MDNPSGSVPDITVSGVNMPDVNLPGVKVPQANGKVPQAWFADKHFLEVRPPTHQWRCSVWVRKGGVLG